MLGSRYTACVMVDEKPFTNQLVHGDSDNDKRKLIKRVSANLLSVMVPQWLAEHNVEIKVHDRITNETITI